VSLLTAEHRQAVGVFGAACLRHELARRWVRLLERPLYAPPCYLDILRILLNSDEAEALKNCAFAGGTATTKWIEDKPAWGGD
jgi:hypothetical protein